MRSAPLPESDQKMGETHCDARPNQDRPERRDPAHGPKAKTGWEPNFTRNARRKINIDHRARQVKRERAAAPNAAGTGDAPRRQKTRASKLSLYIKAMEFYDLCVTRKLTA